MRDLLRVIHELEKTNERRDIENQEIQQQLQHLQSRRTPKIELNDMNDSLSKGINDDVPMLL